MQGIERINRPWKCATSSGPVRWETAMRCAAGKYCGGGTILIVEVHDCWCPGRGMGEMRGDAGKLVCLKCGGVDDAPPVATTTRSDTTR